MRDCDLGCILRPTKVTTLVLVTLFGNKTCALDNRSVTESYG